jgi:hypothetical protein
VLDSRRQALDSAAVPPVERVGLAELHDLFGRACRRPSGWTSARRADRQLPLLVLRVADEAQRRQVVAHISRWCDSARPCRIPVARLSGAGRPAGVPVPLRSELERVHDDFRDIRYPQLRRFSFPRYELTEAVFGYAARKAATVGADHPGRQRDLRASLLDYLASEDALARGMRVAGGADDSAASPWMARFPWIALVSVVRFIMGVAAKPLLRWRLRTRVSALGGQYYWFRKNINTNRGAEADPDFSNQVKFLLDNADQDGAGFAEYADQQRIGALLEDLQHNYLRGLSPWRGWARTVYPVLILDEISPGSHRVGLLNRINESRRVGGRWDPLLVVAVVAEDGCYTELLGEVKNVVSTKNGEPRGAIACYQKWHAQFPGALQPYDQHAWFLFMSVHIAERQDTQTDAELDTGSAIIATRRRPRWTRGSVQATSVLVCAALLVCLWGWRHAASVASAAAYQRRFCADLVLRADGQCVGLAPPGFSFGRNDWTSSLSGVAIAPGQKPPAGDLTVRELETRIQAQDKQVLQESGNGRKVPVVTIAYIGPVTLPASSPTPLTDGVRELAGVYEAQRQSDMRAPDGGFSQPLVRVLVGNAGFEMTYQKAVARRIVQLASHGMPVVGVVGVGTNAQSTPATVGLLSRAGIPIVSTTDSGDRRYDFFFPLAPDDRREAQIGADFLKTMKLRTIHGVRIEDTDPGYTRELSDDLGQALTPAEKRAIPGRPLTYVTAGAASRLPALAKQACAQTHGKLNLIYYAGRGADLNWLISGLSNTACSHNQNQITILSGDDASRDPVPIPARISLDYTALTLPQSLACYQSGANFYGDYQSLLSESGMKVPPDRLQDPFLADAHMVLGYDATMTMEEAAAQVYSSMQSAGLNFPPSTIQMTAGAVWGQLRSEGPSYGATGEITFRPGFEKDKLVAVVQRGPHGGVRVIYRTSLPGGRSPTSPCVPEPQ